MKILNLTLKKQWFDMILSGEKAEEYREIKQYWMTRLTNKKKTGPLEWKSTPRKDYTHILFRNGYSKTAPEMLIKLKEITMRTGKPEWGAIDGEVYFVLLLGAIIRTKNIKTNNMCPHCECFREIEIIRRPEETIVIDTPVTAEIVISKCCTCKEEFSTRDQMVESLDNAFNKAGLTVGVDWVKKDGLRSNYDN
jgi:hypothetical protein